MKKISYLLCAVLALGFAPPEANATTSETHDTFVCTFDLTSDTPSVTCAKEIENGVKLDPTTVPIVSDAPVKIEKTGTEKRAPLDPNAAMNHSDGCVLSDHSCVAPDSSGSATSSPLVAQINKNGYSQKSWRSAYAQSNRGSRSRRTG